MRKLSLPAGTTNRHKWHKEAAAAVSAVMRTFEQRREIYGTHGGEERESLVSVFSYGAKDPQNPEAVELYEQTAERFGWEITRENADEIRDAFAGILDDCRATIPLDDHRKTADEIAEQNRRNAEAEAERKAAADDKAERVDAIAEELRKQYPDAIGRNGKSEQARAAANLKRILQARGLSVSVTSDSFSMGDSVTARVKTPDVAPEIREELDELAERFSYSTFDPMTDCSGYKQDDAGTAWRQVFGRTKYCRIEWERSDENRAAAVEFLGDEAEQDGSASHRIWSGAHCRAAEFWAKWAEDHKQPEPATPAQGGGYEIQKHRHTKRGYNFWLVVLADRVERDTFNELRASCKAAGGWYSRKWGATPGGFAFKEREQAGAWAVQEFGGDDTPPDPKPRGEVKQAEDSRKAAKFREMSDKVRAEVEAKRAPHLENTPKRQREAMARRIDADHLERTAEALQALADLLDAGELPAELRRFSSKKAIYAALRTRTESSGYYHIADTGEASDESPEAAALWALIAHTWGGKDPEQEQADRLRDLRADVKGRKIPGYFPTPRELADEMVDRLHINNRRPWLLLEPSAGCGAILDAVEELANEPEITTVFEINSTLCEILQAKGYDARPVDFLEMKPGAVRYDAVLMNPPFEKLQDVAHVRHAFEFLKPGGRLVAIMAPGPFFHDTAKARDFREWFEDLGGEVEEIEAGAFKESGTGVASRLVVLDKPEEITSALEDDRQRLRDMMPAQGAELTEQGSLF